MDIAALAATGRVDIAEPGWNVWRQDVNGNRP
jgi:hypothetical protein